MKDYFHICQILWMLERPNLRRLTIQKELNANRLRLPNWKGIPISVQNEAWATWQRSVDAGSSDLLICKAYMYHFSATLTTALKYSTLNDPHWPTGSRLRGWSLLMPAYSGDVCKRTLTKGYGFIWFWSCTLWESLSIMLILNNSFFFLSWKCSLTF